MIVQIGNYFVGMIFKGNQLVRNTIPLREEEIFKFFNGEVVDSPKYEHLKVAEIILKLYFAEIDDKKARELINYKLEVPEFTKKVLDIVKDIEFGETLTEKKSKASGKTYTQEHEVVSNDAQEQKQQQWKKRKEALRKKRDQMALYTEGDNTIAASHVKSVLNNVVEGDPSLNNTGRTIAKQNVSSLSKRIQNGEEVTTKDIKKALGYSLGNKAIEALESNGVVFKDADGIGTGDAIDAKTTGSKLTVRVC